MEEFDHTIDHQVIACFVAANAEEDHDLVPNVTLELAAAV